MTMHRMVIPVSALLLGVMLVMVGNGLLTTLISVRLGEAGSNALSNGLVVSGFFLGLVLGSLGAHWIIQQVGHIRAFSALASVFSAASLLHAFQEQPIIWWALRVIEGICMAGLYMCAESWLNERSNNATRGTMLAIYSLTAGIGTGLGQLLLATSAVQGFFLFALSSVLLSLGLVPVALARTPAPPIPTPSRLDPKSLWRLSPLGVSGCIASGLVLGALYGMAPIFGQQIGLDANGIAWFMGATIIGGVALQWPIGRLSDLIDRRLAILLNGFGVAVLSIGLMTITAAKFSPGALELLGFAERGLPDAEFIRGQFIVWIVPLAVLFGTLAFTLYPLSLAHANDFAASDNFVPMSGGLVLSYSIGAMAGPIAASLLMEQLGPLGLFAFTGGVGVLLGMVAFLRMRIAPKLPLEDQAPYQQVPRTSIVAYEMDPRQEDAQLVLELDESQLDQRYDQSR